MSKKKIHELFQQKNNEITGNKLLQKEINQRSKKAVSLVRYSGNSLNHPFILAKDSFMH